MSRNNSKIKILHFANHLTGKADGVFTHILSIIKLTDEKYTHLLCFQGAASAETKLKEIGVNYFILEEFNNTTTLKSLMKLISILRNEKINIVHSHQFKPYIISSILSPFYGYKVIYNYHGEFIKNEYNSKLHQCLNKFYHYLVCRLKLVTLAIVPSMNSRILLQKETNLFPNIEVYYNTNYEEKIPQISGNPKIQIIESLSKKHFLIGIIARQHEQKRIDKALNIFSKIVKNYPNVHFVFCGDGPLLNQMKNYSTQLKIDSCTTFLGYVGNIGQHLQKFNIVFLSSDYEGMPMVIWEAMAASRPIIATDVGGIKEVVEREYCGLLYPSDDLEAGVNCLIKLIENSDLRDELGLNGKRVITEKYNADAFSRRINEIYEIALKMN